MPRYPSAELGTASAKREAYEISYVGFLQELANAGVSFLRVDMRPRTVTYHGTKKKDKYVENVPET